MVTRNQSQGVASATERSFWREAFLAAPKAIPQRRGSLRSPKRAAEFAADFADAAVAEYRRRLTWRNTHDL